MAAICHIRLSKIKNSKFTSGTGECKISSKSVKRLQRYGNLTVFKMAAVRHLGFVKFKFFHGAKG